MSDIPDPDQSTKIESEGSTTVFDNEIGDDWGEAFEADEFMQAPEEGDGTDFFLDDDATPSVAGTDADPSPPKATSTRPSFFANVLNLWPFLQKSCASFRSLSLRYRIALSVVLLLTILCAWLFLGASPSTDSVTGQVAVEQAVPEQTVSGNIEVLGNGISAKDEGGSSAESRALFVAEPEKVRVSWRLPAFLIPAKDNTKGDDVFFVEADISLVFLLSEGESLPASQGVLVRNIIYQFFTNRPIYELRRYSLARGEMNRKLRAWIEKQWSERHIATIVFNRYQVL